MWQVLFQTHKKCGSSLPHKLVSLYADKLTANNTPRMTPVIMPSLKAHLCGIMKIYLASTVFSFMLNE